MSFARAMARGFSLIEMAIVLVVIGILLSGGLMAVTPVLDGTKTTQTNQKLDTIEKALVLYVIRNGCLPCPTNGSTANNAAGVAVGNSGNYTTGCLDAASSSTVCAMAANGAATVPWGALGLSRDDAVDGWGNYISYVVTPALTTNSTAMVRTPPSTYPAGDRDVSSATPPVATGAVAITTAAAYVLISHGKDGAGAYTTGGGATTIANPITGNTYQTRNASGSCDSGGSVCHQDAIYDINDATKFDDLVRWRTAPMIIQLCGNNACGNPA